jgi:zinc D-Ala-D-Ala dipeptidase
VKLPPRFQRPYFPGEPLEPCFAPRNQRFPDNTVDMGTGYDCFDPLAHTDDPAITGVARQNRDLLRDTMIGAGFHNLPEEWWHYTLDNEPFPDTYFDFPVSRRGVR